MGKKDEEKFLDSADIGIAIYSDGCAMPIILHEKVMPSYNTQKRMYHDGRIASEIRPNKNCKYRTMQDSSYFIDGNWDLCGDQAIVECLREIDPHFKYTVRTVKRLRKEEGLPFVKWLRRVWTCTNSVTYWFKSDWEPRRHEKWIRNLPPYTS